MFILDQSRVYIGEGLVEQLVVQQELNTLLLVVAQDDAQDTLTIDGHDEESPVIGTLGEYHVGENRRGHTAQGEEQVEQHLRTALLPLEECLGDDGTDVTLDEPHSQGGHETQHQEDGESTGQSREVTEQETNRNT